MRPSGCLSTAGRPRTILAPLFSQAARVCWPLSHHRHTQKSTHTGQHTKCCHPNRHEQQSNHNSTTHAIHPWMFHIFGPECTHLPHTCPCPHRAARWHVQDHRSNPCRSKAQPYVQHHNMYVHPIQRPHDSGRWQLPQLRHHQAHTYPTTLVQL
jgi:hypothetical protein